MTRRRLDRGGRVGEVVRDHLVLVELGDRELAVVEARLREVRRPRCRRRRPAGRPRPRPRCLVGAHARTIPTGSPPAACVPRPALRLTVVAVGRRCGRSSAWSRRSWARPWRSGSSRRSSARRSPVCVDRRRDGRCRTRGLGVARRVVVRRCCSIPEPYLRARLRACTRARPRRCRGRCVHPIGCRRSACFAHVPARVDAA